MKHFSSLLRLLPALVLPLAASAALVETSAEFQLTADLDGDGREDIVVIDRAGGGFRAAYQLAPGVWTWSAARATGIAAIDGVATGTWFQTDRDALALASSTDNRVHIVRAANPMTAPQITPIFASGIGPAAVASPDIGGGGNTAHADLWIASRENGAPDPLQLATLRHNGADFTPLAQAATSREPVQVRTLALKTGGPRWVAFLGRTEGQPDRFTALGFAGGGAAEILARTVPEGSDWTSGSLAPGALHHVLTWKIGESAFLSHAVSEDAPNVFSLGAGQSFDLGLAIGCLGILASDAGPRLINISPDGSRADVFSFDGDNAPTLLQSFLANNGQSFTGLLPLTGGGFQLLHGSPVTGITSGHTPYSANGGLFVAGVPSEASALRAAALRANVFAFSSEPFVNPDARLLARLTAPEWSSLPVLVGNQLSVTREEFGGPTAGLGSKANLPLGTVPMGTAFALTNQYSPAIAVHSYDPPNGSIGAEVEISPVPGIQTQAVRLTFTATPANAPVYFRLGNGAWSLWTQQDLLIWTNTTVKYYARHPDTLQPSALRHAEYRFETPSHQMDSDNDGVPDFVEKQLVLDPLGGLDSDGDGFSDLNEILSNTDPKLATSTPTPAQRLEENVAFQLRAAPRPIDGTTDTRSTAFLNSLMEAHSLDGNLLASLPAQGVGVPGIIGPGLRADQLVADASQALVAVITEPVFSIATADPDKARGREIAGFFPIPTPAAVEVAFTPGGGTQAVETAAWIAAAQAVYAAAEKPIVSGNFTEIDTLAAFILEAKIEEILIDRNISGISPNTLTLFGGRLGDAARTAPTAGQLASLRLRASDSLAGYHLGSLFQEIQDAATNTPALADARAVATAIYRVSSANSNASPPGTYLPPFDVLRSFVRGNPLPAPYGTDVNLAANIITNGQSAITTLLASLDGRPVESFTLVVGPNSFEGPCHALTKKDSAEIVNLFAAPGLPYQSTDNFTLIPGTELLVSGYTDLTEPCPGLNIEVISVSVLAFPAVPLIDADDNLLPDDWEWAFLPDNANPWEDDDGDGISNLQEFLDGTDPLDANSKAGLALFNSPPQIQIVKDQNGEGVILWWQFPQQYIGKLAWNLQTSQSLDPWHPNAAAVQNPQPGWLSIPLPNAILNDPSQFYRIKMALKP